MTPEQFASILHELETIREVLLFCLFVISFFATVYLLNTFDRK